MASARPIDFIIAGVQKGGTTALFDYLAEQPDLAFSTVKETHFFDDEGRDWRAPDYSDYHALFPVADRRLRGEATPIYLYWPRALERIAAYNPAVRLIVLLRDPVERAWSHWRMEYARGVETQTFAWCIREGRRRLFEAAPWGHHREFSYVERGFYGEQLERLFGLFPREQVLVMRSTALRDDPTTALGEVSRFLGVAGPKGAVTKRTIHAGREMAYPSELGGGDRGFLRQLYAADQARLADLVGWSFGADALARRN